MSDCKIGQAVKGKDDPPEIKILVTILQSLTPLVKNLIRVSCRNLLDCFTAQLVFLVQEEDKRIPD